MQTDYVTLCYCTNLKTQSINWEDELSLVINSTAHSK